MIFCFCYFPSWYFNSTTARQDISTVQSLNFNLHFGGRIFPCSHGGCYTSVCCPLPSVREAQTYDRLQGSSIFPNIVINKRQVIFQKRREFKYSLATEKSVCAPSRYPWLAYVRDNVFETFCIEPWVALGSREMTSLRE